MDTTYGTNSSALTLFVVLGKNHGTGLPLGYCLVGPLRSPREAAKNKTIRGELGALTSILQQFIEWFKIYGLNPKFFLTDKDLVEIGAIRYVWPSTRIQICYWHALRAIKTKLNTPNATNMQTSYWPEEAQKLIPHLHR